MNKQSQSHTQSSILWLVARATGAAVLVASSSAYANASTVTSFGLQLPAPTVAAIGRPVVGGFQPQRGQMRPANVPCNIKVWASSLGGGIVQGYTVGGAPCGAAINGSSSGTPFAAPFALATDTNGNLYVADVNNSRVVVFNAAGGYLATMNTLPTEQPYSVCVSPKGIVAIADRPAAGGAGDVEFFTNYTFSSMTGNASGVVNTFDFCAFDAAGNFFADGTVNGGGQKITYLRRALVNMPSQTVLDSGLGSATYWLGMYVQIGFKELSVGGNYMIQNFHINPVTGKPVGPATITALTGYPTSIDAFYQAAPSHNGPNSTIYIADYGLSTVLKAPVGGPGRPGGPISTFHSLSTTVGVATEPTGQY